MRYGFPGRLGAWCAVVMAALAPAASGGMVYFSDKDAKRLHRVPSDGSGPLETLLTTAGGRQDPRGVALDLAAGKMYFADGVAAKIRRANRDGTGQEDLITTGLFAPSDLALDLAGGKMYWADRDSDSIRRADLNGGNVTTVRSGVFQPRWRFPSRGR